MTMIKNGNDDNHVAIEFLQIIFRATKKLAKQNDFNNDDDEEMIDSNQEEAGNKSNGTEMNNKNKNNDNDDNPTNLIHMIAVNLLKACVPGTLSSDIVPSLPKLAIESQHNDTTEPKVEMLNDVDDDTADDDDDDDANENDNDNDDNQYQSLQEYSSSSSSSSYSSSTWKYQFRRTDYLRQVLHLIAPISMEVAVHIIDISIVSVLQQQHGKKQQQDQQESKNENISLFVLFAHWLPIAPHLTTIVTELFQLLNNPFNDTNASNNTSTTTTANTATTTTNTSSSLLLHTQFVIAEASYYVCNFYAQRGDIESIKYSIDWSFLSMMIMKEDTEMTEAATSTTSNNDDDDDDDNTKKNTKKVMYNIQTAIRWYAARAIASIYDWRPEMSTKFLQQLQLDDERVPWCTHPWILDYDEERAQESRFRNQTTLWNTGKVIQIPSMHQLQCIIPSYEAIVSLGQGLSYYKTGYLLNLAKRVKNVSTSKTMTSLSSSSLDHKKMDATRTSTTKKKDDDDDDDDDENNKKRNRRLIHTPTTCRNLFLLGAALCDEPYPPPILICGPHGSGKSSLVRELLRMCRPPDEELLEFHVDEETDSKSLIGSYTITDIPGEFAWRAGALTHASRSGRWVLLEDIDSVPIEIQATLVKLFEGRLLPLGNGKYERCHPNFRIFGTCTTQGRTSSSQQRQQHSMRIGSNRGGGKRILHPSLWRKVHVRPLPFSELKDIAVSLHPALPATIIDSALGLFKTLDRSGRDQAVISDPHNNIHGRDDDDDNNDDDLPDNAVPSSGGPGSHTILNVATSLRGRIPSVRDFLKLLSRISQGIRFEKDAVYATEGQRTLCLAESVDVFLGSCPDKEERGVFVNNFAAPNWSISRDLARSYVDSRRPPIVNGANFVEVGRARIDLSTQIMKTSSHRRVTSKTFAQTNHALRLMESLAVCVRENEPVLLVGETGCGKTTLIQQLAVQCECDLVVQNLSLQTDSTDLLGGYRPLELHHVARKVHRDFVDIFVSTFSRKQNIKFLQYASSMLEKTNWKKLSQCFKKAVQLGLSKMDSIVNDTKNFTGKKPSATLAGWEVFARTADKFELQRISCDAGLAFVFSEGALVEAIKTGKWVLLDEINLASSDTLQRLCGLLDEPTGSLTLTERGDDRAIVRHSNFRLFAAMNPATDAGKKDLPASIRSRFSELFVDELMDPVELRSVAAGYLDGVIPASGKPPEHSEIVISVVDIYLKCRGLAETSLSDGGGNKPRYTLRTLSRALSAAKVLVVEQRIPLHRAIYEGFQLAFEGALDATSTKSTRKLLKSLLGSNVSKSDLEHPGRRPEGRQGDGKYILIKPFWIKSGTLEPTDWSSPSADGTVRFILTPSISSSLRRLSRSLAAGPWPILLEGPTSAGKTTLVEYVAARCGHRVIRINNHEHTDVQEYTGSFVADQNGSLSFRDGLLVRALRKGYWVILDELNLAPSEVLEALNRLLDDNRELYIAEINETVKPHPNFRLFATQNPSGAYGGRKPLSRAFRNRFVEIHMGDIPSGEMVSILEKRCACPPSHAKLLVNIMVSLRQRRSNSNVFLGKDSLITPRDLLRWAERHAGSKLELAQEGYMLLAERLRSEEEKLLVHEVLRTHLKVNLNMQDLYFGQDSEARKLLNEHLNKSTHRDDPLISSLAPTKSLLRLISLVLRCLRQKEPVLLVGDTGCGKTTVVQFLSLVFGTTLHAVNCHATTETSDLLGGLRPVRGREMILEKLLEKVKELIAQWPYHDELEGIDVPIFLRSGNQAMDDGTEMPRQWDADKLLSLARSVFDAKPKDTATITTHEVREQKRRKLTSAAAIERTGDDNGAVELDPTLMQLMDDIEDLARRHSALFEWCDGPLVRAMRAGDMLLLDEMSLAEDAVLERLNSVLEPSRTLVLAEKGDDPSDTETESRIIVADEAFRIFATMNPGGDYGKKELSPALRSRFTEIWVPAITERDDFELVLGRTLAPKNLPVGPGAINLVLGRMLAYVQWFNGEICGDTASPYSSFTLTLRDVLSWARFIVESRKSNETLGQWEAYIHGACLMHLDGLGLGAGVAVEDVVAVKIRSEEFLLDQIPDGESVADINQVEPFVLNNDNLFGSPPFFIPAGPLPIPQSKFNMTAPTTAQNMFRVLRALQLSKPILLEGSPGVGKTSLISALAEASGHKLVRINLSEQTDIADLMGSDLPVPDSRTGGAAFEWCDGILLTAIKEGSWVLLDELNLASQSVLEGLNSCLDHRSTVFIPELGKTFNCPKTFRVFGAQNPLGQGGGRKGLPKSFLNRFTKVAVASLTDSDLRAIVTMRYPKLPKADIDNMIDFNNQVHKDVVDEREYGSEGSPWEFNLRDVFRWCELLSDGAVSNEVAAHDLYLLRFRNVEDRKRIEETFKRHFNCPLKSPRPPKFRVTRSSIQIGNTILPRIDGNDWNKQISKQKGAAQCFSSLHEMEAVARSVALKWPCLLVGPSGSGKTSIVSTLADLCGIKLVQQCLTPSSDVTELVGCFEQVDVAAGRWKAVADLCSLVETVVYRDGFRSYECQQVYKVGIALKGCLTEARNLAVSTRSLDKQVESHANELSRLLAREWCKACSVDQEDIAKRIAKVTSKITAKRNPTTEESNAGCFVWRDGVLVEAMRNGWWLLLENVNLCPSSVLDRLNSVMEKGGEFLLSECGTHDEGEDAISQRLIKPHPNFRIFLSMDALNGEVSRAMRNRCMEIYLRNALSSEDLHDKNVVRRSVGMLDFLDGTRQAGARSLELGSVLYNVFVREMEIATSGGEELPSIRAVSACTATLTGLLSRGVPGTLSMRSFLGLSYELDEATTDDILSDSCFTCLQSQKFNPLPGANFRRLSWLGDPCQAHVSWDARVLRLFMGGPKNLLRTFAQSGLPLLPTYVANAEKSTNPAIWHPIPSHAVLSESMTKQVLGTLVQIYLEKSTTDDYDTRFSFLDGIENSCSQAMKVMVSIVRQSRQTSAGGMSSSFGADDSTTRPYFSTGLHRLRLHRLWHSFSEQLWRRHVTKRVSAVNAIDGLKVLDASFFLHESMLERSSIKCPVTPSLFPFYRALDAMIEHSSREIVDLQGTEQTSILSGLALLMDERDKLWRYLVETPIRIQSSTLLYFDDTEFVVQWKWLKKRYWNLCSSEIFRRLGHKTQKSKSHVDVFMGSIDTVVFGTHLDDPIARAVRKKLMRPAVPQKASQWEVIFKLRKVAAECTIINDDRFDPLRVGNGCIALKDLVEQQHPLLFVTSEEKNELLAALSTFHWCSTGEASAEEKTDASSYMKMEMHERICKMFADRQRTFARALAKAKVDTEIRTVENQFSVEVLDTLKESSDLSTSSVEAYFHLVNILLSSYSRMQVSTIAELWCVIEETVICGEFSRLLADDGDEDSLVTRLSTLLPRVKKLVSVALSTTLWPVNDLRPYQTIVWAIEGSKRTPSSFRRLLRALLPRMLQHRWQHMRKSALVSPEAVSAQLDLPSMWADDDGELSSPSFPYARSSSEAAHVCSGSTLLRRGTRSKYFVNMIGKQLELSSSNENSRFHTMENHRFRLSQYQELVKMGSSFSTHVEKADYSILRCLAIDVLEGIQSSQTDDDVNLLLDAVKQPSRLRDLAVSGAVEGFRSPYLQQNYERLLKPLILALDAAHRTDCPSEQYTRHIAVASVLLGILRLDLYIPESPVDPGRVPLAKVRLFKKSIEESTAQILSRRIDAGITTGDFNPETAEITTIISAASNLDSKRKKQEKRVIERVEWAPPYVDFFREVSSFTTSIAGTEVILQLLAEMRSSDGGLQKVAAKRAMNWQSTASAVCTRVCRNYEAFEDVTVPVVESIQMIQDGFDSLILLLDGGHHQAQHANLFSSLLRYPMDDIPTGTWRKLIVASSTSPDCSLSLGLASLSRLAVKGREIGFSSNDIAWCTEMIAKFASSTYVSEKDGDTDLKSAEQQEEHDFREQFPDYGKDFQGLLDENPMDNSDVSDDEEEVTDNSEPISHTLSESQIGLLCSIHLGLFGDNSSDKVTDSLRAIAFHASYGAAYQLDKTFNCSDEVDFESESMGGHVLGLAFSMKPKVGTTLNFSFLHRDDKMIDFQNEPCPSEALKASDPITRLVARATQLLTAFPGHSVLLGVGRVCDKVRKLNIMTTPLGKFMTGLELVLRHAQDWEQHASEKVRLGTALREVGSVVAGWRKKELEGWPQLIHAREQRCIGRARKLWPRLVGMFFDDANEAERGADGARTPTTSFLQVQAATPKWVWKRVGNFGAALSNFQAEFETEQIVDLVKTLDTFILTSPVGEFEERLNLVKAFVGHLEADQRARDFAIDWKLMQARLLSSTGSYYSQFRKTLSEKLASMRSHIEKKLKDEVKLAKWDEQSYYALAESTEKNHRKLMKILSEYDECLELNFGVWVQEVTCKGVRSDADSQDKVSTSVPSNALMFPLSEGVHHGTDGKPKQAQKTLGKSHRWTELPTSYSERNDHVQRLRKYAKKMQAVTAGELTDRKKWAVWGGRNATYLCEAIFERVDTLRTKSTRPMKERALKDLFRELKQNGFTTTKWAVPAELKRMELVFQLPTPSKPSVTGSNKERWDVMDKAELYYMKCMAENNALTSEVNVFGSRHMTRREMDIMLNMCASGLLMLSQQRCLVSNLINDLSALKVCETTMRSDRGTLPVPQSPLRRCVSDFESRYKSAAESVAQLSFALRSSQRLVDRGGKETWVSDVISKLQNVAFNQNFTFQQHHDIVTWDHLDCVEKECKTLEDTRSLLLRYLNECKRLGLLPSDLFDVPLACIEKAIAAASQCKKLVGGTRNDSAETTGGNNTFWHTLSSSIERALISFQNIAGTTSKTPTETASDTIDDEEKDTASLWECHEGQMKAWAGGNLRGLVDSLSKTLEQLRDFHDAKAEGTTDGIKYYVGLVSDVSVLVNHVTMASESFLHETLLFYANMAKLNYVLLRIFRVLVAQGYCSDETQDDDGQDNDGDISGMNFEDDQDGTGMGEGEGKNDVTDQLENEEQLLGLKSDADDQGEQQEKNDPKQLDEEEAEKGMEMEGDFDGEMYDLPDKPDDVEGEDDDSGEELDRQMGDEESPDDQVVDEKMWNDSDDEEDVKKEDEKFEKDNAVEGEAIEGETRTKEDEDEKEGKQEEDNPSQAQNGGDDDMPNDVDNDDIEAEINEDDEDNYEENYGADVRHEENEAAEEQGEEDGDDMQLDDICLDGDDAEAEEQDGDQEDGENPPDAMDDSEPNNDDDDDGDGDENEAGNESMVENKGEEEEEGEEDAVNESANPSSAGANEVDDPMEEQNDENEDEDGDNDEKNLETSNEENAAAEETHGVRSKSGTDAVLDDGAKEDQEDGNPDDDNQQEEADGADGTSGGDTTQGEGSTGIGYDNSGKNDEAAETNNDINPSEIPNPFKDPGDASAFWHKKLNIVPSTSADEEAVSQEDDVDIPPEEKAGEYEYTNPDQKSSTQVLGETTEEEAVELEHQKDEMEDEEDEETKDQEQADQKKDNSSRDSMTSKKKKEPSTRKKQEEPLDNETKDDGDSDEENHNDAEEPDHDVSDDPDGDDDQMMDDLGNQVVSDMTKLHVDSSEQHGQLRTGKIIEDEQITGISTAEMGKARAQWLRIQGETNNLSRRLCEKLRLVMEPLVASKLRGDYRSGKRINMKRVIGYIASGYRKDKIWLRRTKPAKRDYRVLLAVDDSESMKKSGAGEMAMKTMATLAVGMNQLEIGELGIASFGDDMKLLHPFHLPFTSESGTNMVMNFGFDQKRTRTALCVESAIASMDAMGDHSSMQLVFLISDGRIERDSRSTLKRLIREMMERNILLAMIIVEGENKKDSIVNMKEVSFEKGKPVMKRFIEEYPFPYYMIVNDMAALPEIVGDALRQWFEMLSQLKS